MNVLIKATLSSSSDVRGNRNLHVSSSTPNFDAENGDSYYGDQSSSRQSLSGYQNFKDQKDAFFTKKQLENCGRPE